MCGTYKRAHNHIIIGISISADLRIGIRRCYAVGKVGFWLPGRSGSMSTRGKRVNISCGKIQLNGVLVPWSCVIG